MAGRSGRGSTPQLLQLATRRFDFVELLLQILLFFLCLCAGDGLDQIAFRFHQVDAFLRERFTVLARFAAKNGEDGR